MYKKRALIIFIVATVFLAPSLMSQNKYIKSGENLTFTASFSVSGVMTDVAQVKMETSTVKTKTRELLKLNCTARTYSSWDSYFKVQDSYVSYVSPKTLIPFLFRRNIHEGNYKKKIKYLFKRKSKYAVSTLNKKGIKNKKTRVPITYSTRDIVSTIYKVRTLDFDNFAVGKKVLMRFIVDSKVQAATIKYLGKKSIKMGKYGYKECYKLSIGFYGKELENTKGNKFIWITADEDRLPALIKANIPVGSIQIRLENYTK